MSDFGLFLLMFAALALAVGVIRGLAWLTDFVEAGGIRGAIERGTDRYVVNRYEEDDAPIMSRSEETHAPSMPSSLQTDGRQTADRQPAAQPSRDVMLDTYKRLRKLNMSRDEARTMLKALGLPLDNNLWTQAAPAEDEIIRVTPIAGRPTKAQFETDPELMYQPPN